MSQHVSSLHAKWYWILRCCCGTQFCSGAGNDKDENDSLLRFVACESVASIISFLCFYPAKSNKCGRCILDLKYINMVVKKSFLFYNNKLSDQWIDYIQSPLPFRRNRIVIVHNLNLRNTVNKFFGLLGKWHAC